jgi:hypothetical protein
LIFFFISVGIGVLPEVLRPDRSVSCPHDLQGEKRVKNSEGLKKVDTKLGPVSPRHKTERFVKHLSFS